MPEYLDVAAEYGEHPETIVALESLDPNQQVGFPVGEFEMAQGPARVALIYRELMRYRYTKEGSRRVLRSPKFCLVGLDVHATKNVLASMEVEKRKYPHKKMHLKMVMFNVAPRVAHTADGKPDFNHKTKPLLYTSADGSRHLDGNEVSVDMVRGFTPQIILFDERVFGISCNTAGLLHYLHEATMLITLVTERLRADAEEFIFRNNISMYDLRLDQGAVPFSSSPGELLSRFNELFDQQTSESDDVERRSPHDPPPRLMRSFVRKKPDGSLDLTDTVGLEILQKVLTKIPLSGLHRSPQASVESSTPGAINRHSGMRFGNDFVILDNLWCLSNELDEDLRKHPEKRLPLALGTMLTMSRLPEDNYLAWQRAKKEDLDLLQKFAPLSQEVVWRFKISHNEKHPPEVFSWYKATDLHSKQACYAKFAQLLHMLHAHGVERVLLVCTELPVLWELFKNNPTLRWIHRIFWDLPEVIDPSPSVIKEAANFMEAAK